MTRKIAKNPSGKYIQMTDAELERDRAAFERAVERQMAKDAAAANPRTMPLNALEAIRDRAREMALAPGATNDQKARWIALDDLLSTRARREAKMAAKR